MFTSTPRFFISTILNQLQIAIPHTSIHMHAFPSTNNFKIICIAVKLRVLDVCMFGNLNGKQIGPFK